VAVNINWMLGKELGHN